MKKLLFAACFLITMGSIANAQTPLKTKTKHDITKTKMDDGSKTKVSALTGKTKNADGSKVKANKNEHKSKSELSKTKVHPATVTTKTKSNSGKTKSISPVTNANTLKKDCTPDKRFSSNKHLKQDGSKYLRYKENKTTTKTKSN